MTIYMASIIWARGSTVYQHAIILETMLPFVMVFERRRPQARELIVIAVLCAVGVAGRAAFFMLPQFKPVTAVVIIAGVAFGGEAGFLVGAVTAFVSNMFFGQGPWTPWQMFAFGIIGFLAGVLFRKGILRRNTAALCAFGGLATFFIYGGIMNPAAVLMFQSRPTPEMFYLAYLQGIPFDLVHAAATVVFLWFIASLLEKLDRIKVKYGLVEVENERFSYKAKCLATVMENTEISQDPDRPGRLYHRPSVPLCRGLCRVCGGSYLGKPLQRREDHRLVL